MTIEKLAAILKRGEGIEIEFKTSLFELNKDIFDTICSFLNRMGGHLVLGVKDNGQVEGIVESCVPAMVNNLVTMANNPNKLNPPIACRPQVLDYEGKKIIYCYVPESPEVHTTNGKMFDRTGEGDQDITRLSWRVTNVYLRKHGLHTEDRVLPYFELADCNKKMFKRVRQMANAFVDEHPWMRMTDIEIIRSARFYGTDIDTGRSGMTVAAALIFGNDAAIGSALSAYKTDALLRIENLDSYDDRDIIVTNLIDSYDRLMAFIARHLPDKFYLEGDMRISLRYRLFREVVTNLLIHREFSDPSPARLVIEHDKVYTENWSRPHGWGSMSPEHFDSFPKNPNIASFFRELGLSDQLGSGLRKIFRYGPQYTPGTIPQIIEGDLFKTIIPLKPLRTYDHEPSPSPFVVRENDGNRLIPRVGIRLSAIECKIMKRLSESPATTIAELAAQIGISKTTIENKILKLKQMHLLRRVGSDRAGRWAVQTP